MRVFVLSGRPSAMATRSSGVAAPGKVRRIARFPDCGIQGGAVGLNVPFYALAREALPVRPAARACRVPTAAAGWVPEGRSAAETSGFEGR
jgi:hypothetical protein